MCILIETNEEELWEVKMLDWKLLLCEERMRGPNPKKEINKNVTRNEFEADYDRIVGSSSVRRLQDKAQLFPLQKNDVVRTRLTHSMEVSAIARSLAKTIGLKLEEKGEFGRAETEKLMGMLQTAGLIHDLGNPPFGHYGETVIRNWYNDKVLKEKNKCKDNKYQVTQEDTDFLCFDGNVQNLRIVTKLQTMNDEYGANFTYGTLASIIKYPYSSQSTKHEKNKFGYFKSEENIVQKIWEHTGLEEGVRHPATYLLEAADDIVYLCDDIEDGVKKGYIPWDKEYSLIKDSLKSESKYLELFKKIDEKIPARDLGEEECVLARIRVFRNLVQGYLMNTAIDGFMNNYDKIMEGKFGMSELLEADKDLINILNSIKAKYCFACNEVLTLETVGDRTIKELLNIFYDAISTPDIESLEKISHYEGKIYNMISDNYKFIARINYNDDKHPRKELIELSEYDKIHLIVDFVSGMTDSYAVSLYKKLLGISLPD